MPIFYQILGGVVITIVIIVFLIYRKLANVIRKVEKSETKSVLQRKTEEVISANAISLDRKSEEEEILIVENKSSRLIFCMVFSNG